MAEKTYINGLIIKEYGKFGSMNVSIKVDELQEAINQHSNNGWLNVTIHKRNVPTDSGITHYTVLDEYKPKNNEEATNT